MPGSAVNKYIDSQVKSWQKREKTVDIKETKLPFLTISREYGCCAYEIAEKIAEVLNSEYNSNPPWAPFNKQLLEKIMEDMGLSQSLAETLTANARKAVTEFIQTSFSKFPPQVAVYRKLADTIRTLASNGNVIIIGRAGSKITEGLDSGVHIRLVAPLSIRTESLAAKTNISTNEAQKLIAKKTKERESFIKEFVKYNTEDPVNYHLTINKSYFSTEQCARLIIKVMKITGKL